METLGKKTVGPFEGVAAVSDAFAQPEADTKAANSSATNPDRANILFFFIDNSL